MQLSWEPEFQTPSQIDISRQRKRIFSEIVENYTGQKLWESGEEKLSPKGKAILKITKERFWELLQKREVSIVTPEFWWEEQDSLPVQILYGHSVRQWALEIQISIDEMLSILSPKISLGEIETIARKKIDEKKCL